MHCLLNCYDGDLGRLRLAYRRQSGRDPAQQGSPLAPRLCVDGHSCAADYMAWLEPRPFGRADLPYLCCKPAALAAGLSVAMGNTALGCICA